MGGISLACEVSCGTTWYLSEPAQWVVFPERESSDNCDVCMFELFDSFEDVENLDSRSLKAFQASHSNSPETEVKVSKFV